MFIHAGVNTNLIPATGMTLPFLSYGGSSFIVTFVMMGMLARIHQETQPVEKKKSKTPPVKKKPKIQLTGEQAYA